MNLFEYAIIFTPKDIKNEKAKLLVPVATVLASNQNNATILASREIPKEYLDHLDEVSVAVRSF